MAYDVGEVLEQAATQIRRFMPVMMHATECAIWSISPCALALQSSHTAFDDTDLGSTADETTAWTQRATKMHITQGGLK